MNYAAKGKKGGGQSEKKTIICDVYNILYTLPVTVCVDKGDIVCFKSFRVVVVGLL